MNKKLLILGVLILMLLVILPVASAGLGSFKQNECVNIKTILNTSTVTLSSISYPNSSVALTNGVMTKNLLTFNYSFCDTSQLGTYTYDYYEADGTPYVNDFIITYTGDVITSEQSSIYIIALIALVLFALGLFYIRTTLPGDDSRDEQGRILQINQLKHIRPLIMVVIWVIALACIFIVANMAIAFLPNAMIGNLFFAMYKILFWITIIGTPVYFIYIILKFFEDKEFKKMIERGVEIGGNV